MGEEREVRVVRAVVGGEEDVDGADGIARADQIEFLRARGVAEIDESESAERDEAAEGAVVLFTAVVERRALDPRAIRVRAGPSPEWASR